MKTLVLSESLRRYKMFLWGNKITKQEAEERFIYVHDINPIRGINFKKSEMITLGDVYSKRDYYDIRDYIETRSLD